jgi:phosphohistidine swiveling domain-containing protein
MELKAHFFRKFFLKDRNDNYSQNFCNWEFIFHYFRLFCMLKKVKPKNESFAQFLIFVSSNHFLSQIIRQHFNLANSISIKNSDQPLDFHFFDSNGLNFIGKNIHEININDPKLYAANKLDPQIIYHLKEVKIILTGEVGLLSHGVLAAIDQQMMIVTGIQEEFWTKLKKDDTIFLDFEKKILKIL